METAYILVGICGSFIFGFLVGLFFGIGKFKKKQKTNKNNYSELGDQNT